MFWKKKKNEPILLPLNDPDQRADVRIQPMEPLLLQVHEQPVELLDISASGLSFKSAHLDSGDSLAISLHLPEWTRQHADDVPVIHCTIKILRVKQNICHCQFTVLESEARQQLERYLLAEQKRQIRTNKQK